MPKFAWVVYFLILLEVSANLIVAWLATQTQVLLVIPAWIALRVVAVGARRGIKAAFVNPLTIFATPGWSLFGLHPRPTSARIDLTCKVLLNLLAFWLFLHLVDFGGAECYELAWRARTLG